jgi:hypothetical protein
MKGWVAPKQWNRIDKFTVEASDGSKVWIDVRGLVGFERTNGDYVSLGAEFSHDSKSDRTFPISRKNIHVYVNQVLSWERDGSDTGKKISKDVRQKFLESIKEAMNSLGYSIRYIYRKE